LVTDYLRAKGALNTDFSVLDIGCGPGVYALRFAPYVGRVVALDSAPQMCRVLTERAQSQGITNITPVNRAWEEIDLKETGWERKFDLVFASLTPAVGKPEGFLKMMAASRRYCCLVQFARGDRNPVLAELWPAVVGRRGSGSWYGVHYPWNYLYSSGYLPEVHFIPNHWTEERPLADALAHYRRSLQRFVTLTPAVERRLHRYLTAHSEGGIFRYTYRSYLAVLFWEVGAERRV